MKLIFPPAILTSLLLGVPAGAALRGPYVQDAATVHLYHFSEEAGGGMTANSGTVGGAAFSVDANPATGAAVTNVLGGTGYSGFGKAADFAGKTDHLIGFDANASGAYQTDQSGAIPSPDVVTLGTLGIDGATPFTLEAMVKPASLTGNREIICTDSSAGTRGFQFRLTTGGTTGQRVEFNLIGVAGAQRFGEIPAAGDHAITVTDWFHVAMVYDGTNLQFYWTRIDPATVTANPLDAAQALAITGGSTIAGPLVLGNENRAAAAEGLNGLLDEVRISSVARTAADFAFVPPSDVDGDGLEDTWELAYFPNLDQGALSDPDGDGFSNAAEFAGGSNPTMKASTPPDLDADGLGDVWEVANFGNTTAQNGSGDPDNDYASNAQEFAASSLPLDHASFPDAEGGTGDGLCDPWEVLYLVSTAALPGADADGDGYSNLDEFRANTHPNNANWTPAKAQLRNRWSFSSSPSNPLADPVGSSPATVVDPDTDPLIGGTAVFADGKILLGGGARATSSYIQLGSNLLQGLKTPVSLELWASQESVQNWSRIFDFGSGTSEYFFMSWTQGTNQASDRVGWVDGVVSEGNNTINPYTPGTQFHIVLTIEPGLGAGGATLVSWYAQPVGIADLSSARGSFTTDNSLSQFNDAFNLLGRSQFTGDNTANASYDEFRIWNGALSFEEREAFHDAGPNVLDLADTDGDGLPDAWEILNFPSIAAQNGSGDPDLDLFTNQEEFLANTNPNQIFSSPDTDADGLPDGWEVLWFRSSPTETLIDITAKTAGTDDTDSDTYSNRDEYTALTNPNAAAFTPINKDGDGLIDTWEIFWFNDLDETGTGNPDGDSGSNQQEQMAGSNPALATSTPADTDGDGMADNTRAIKPYKVDASTLQLWHLDELVPAALNAADPGLPLASLTNGAVLWAPSAPGFATGLNPSAGRGTANGGVLSALPLTADTADNTTLSYAGEDGAFTFEAIVRTDFDPAAPPQAGTGMQILSGEGDTGANRVFQFRIVPTAGAPVLQFINLHGEVDVQTLSAPLPTGAQSGAIVQGNWYHVAVAYNGAEGTPDNIKFYWSPLDPLQPQATLLLSTRMTSDLIVESPDFAIGNEGRATGGSSEAFAGVIDEVRISSMARAPSGFLFVSPGDLDGDGMPDVWENTYFNDLDETASGDSDQDGTNNLSEYRLGLIPNSGSSRFSATLAGGSLTWPSAAGLNFTVERSQDLVDTWIQLATMAGSSGTTSYTDPDPPVGRAYYRVVLHGP